MRKLHYSRGIHNTLQNGGGLSLPAGGAVGARVCMYMSLAYGGRWLAYALVCVDVALTVRAAVCHILQVIDQTGNQAAAQIAPANKEEHTV